MTEQLPLLETAPALFGHAWRCFTADTPEEQAAAVFVRRYGQAPAFILEGSGMLWLGPVPGQEGKS